MAAVLVCGCGHVGLVGDDSVHPPVGGCRAVDDNCGGSGTADTAVSITVATALVGVLGLAIYQRLTNAL